MPPSGDPGPKLIYDNRVFFAAYRPVTGRELYWTPLIAGDYPYRELPKGHDDLIPGFAGSNPGNFTTYCGRMFFTADRVINGVPYSQVLNTIGPGTGDVVADTWDDLQQDGSIFYNVEQLTHWGDELWFIAEGYSPVYQDVSRFAWRIYNPFPNQCVTEMVHFEPASSGHVPFVHELESAGRGVAVAISYDNFPVISPMDIVISGGTPSTTEVLVEDLQIASELTHEPSQDFLYFISIDPDLRTRLERYDLGGSLGHLVLKMPDGPSFQPIDVMELFPAAGFVYFGASSRAFGRELWRSLGFLGDTQQVVDLNPGPLASNPFDFRQKGGSIFFLAEPQGDAFADGLFRSGIGDLTDVERLGAMDYPRNLTLLSDDLFYFAGHIWADGTFFGQELWLSDGTVTGTIPCANLNPGGGASAPNHFILYYNDVGFSATEGDLGRELHILPYGVCPGITGGGEEDDEDPPMGGQPIGP